MNLRIPFLSPAEGIPFRLKLAGVAILFAGFVAAISIWIAQGQSDRHSDSDDGIIPRAEDSRRAARDLELYYGKTGALADKWNRWFEELSHGRPLAVMIAIISMLIAGALFFVATIHPGQPPVAEAKTPDGKI